jgi:hypothetical protein
MPRITLLAFGLAALAATAHAQNSTNVPTVTLSGKPYDPTITNHSGKQIIAAMVIRQLADGTHTVSQRLFTKEPNQLPDGGSVEYGTYSNKPMNEVSAKITAVVFADGEFRGEDSYEFQSNTERHLQAMRQVWQMAKAGDWKGIKAKSEEKDPDSVFAMVLAMRIQQARIKDGDAKAVDSFAYVGHFPASTWKSETFLHKLGISGVYESIASWFVPTAYAQSGPQPIPASPARQR